MTNVFISIDMEGIAGIAHLQQVIRGTDDFPASRELMTDEANAAVAGAYEGGATAVVVNDSHGDMYNLLAERMDARAELLIGSPKVLSMMQGFGPEFDVALFVGYHTRAGHPTGVISHTYSDAPVLTSLGGRPVGESGINAAVLGSWGVPVGLVAGDDALAAETEDWLPWAERVVVKHVVSRHAAAAVHPSVARERVRAGAQRAIARAAAGELRPLVIDPPVVIEIEFRDAGEADHAAIAPGLRRTGDRGVRIEAPDVPSAYRGFLAAVRLAGLVGEVPR